MWLPLESTIIFLYPVDFESELWKNTHMAQGKKDNAHRWNSRKINPYI